MSGTGALTHCPRCAVALRAGDTACPFCDTVVAEPRSTALSRLRDRGGLEIGVLAAVVSVVAVTWIVVLLHR